MPREILGSVTQWPAGPDTDWAYEIAISFLIASLGDPPCGAEFCVVDEDHELGTYPALAVIWPDASPEPRDYIREAEGALCEFNDAIDWTRLRPSNFWPTRASAGS